MRNPHAPSLGSLKLGTSLYATIENHVTETSQTSKAEVIYAVAQILQEIRDHAREKVVIGTFSHFN